MLRKCKKAGHIKSECPRLKKATKKKTSKEKAMMATWEVLDRIAWERGLKRAFKILYNMENFNNTIYLKCKTWIMEAIMLVYKTV